MRQISSKKITQVVADLCKKANFILPFFVKSALEEAYRNEESERGREVIHKIIENAGVALSEDVPMCQDCGITTVFAEIGQEISVIDGDLKEAINQGVRQGYKEGYLRKSIVEEPVFNRKNTSDNTPAIIYFDIVPGNSLKIVVVPKGGGSENTSALKMLNPSDGIEGIKKFVMETVEKAGPNACPPMIIGVGIGGSFDSVGILAKKALLEEVYNIQKDDNILGLEKELLKDINRLGIGPAGLGGRITALKVNINTFPTHIGCLPVAVSVSCHALRYAWEVL
ncbi:MAG: fumarate hydratase [Actinobacteria bacterium]|nr:fumarate hydratase [Actinomycetota bacterium]